MANIEANLSRRLTLEDVAGLTDLVAVRANLGQLGLEAGRRSLETLLAVPTALGADFLVKGNIDGVPVSLLVECDGHAYHDRTPEQAARDRQRDRSLKLTDYEVIRFTASEITSDPEGCALEVFSQMVAVARRAGPRP